MLMESFSKNTQKLGDGIEETGQVNFSHFNTFFSSEESFNFTNIKRIMLKITCLPKSRKKKKHFGYRKGTDKRKFPLNSKIGSSLYTLKETVYCERTEFNLGSALC